MKNMNLNAMLREWLARLTARSLPAAADGASQEFDAVMNRLKHVRAGRRFTRDEMNDR